VLQSGVRDHQPQLLDGWDKLAAIYLTADWPYCARHRARMRYHHGHPENPALQLGHSLIERIRQEGNLSSIDHAHLEKTQGGWPTPARWSTG